MRWVWPTRTASATSCTRFGSPGTASAISARSGAASPASPISAQPGQRVCRGMISPRCRRSTNDDRCDRRHVLSPRLEGCEAHEERFVRQPLRDVLEGKSMLTVSSRTHPGAVRTTNEDRVLWDPELQLFAVADGMGGHNAGEVASRLTIDTIRMFLQKSANDHDCTWPFGVNPSLSFETNRLLTAVKLANRRV